MRSRTIVLSFEFDEGNLEKLHKRNVGPDDIYEILRNKPAFIPNKKAGAGTLKMVGSNRSGRKITVIFFTDEYHMPEPMGQVLHKQ